MTYTNEAPLEYAEFQLARETGWDIDKVSNERVSVALQFMSLEARYKKKPDTK